MISRNAYDEALLQAAFDVIKGRAARGVRRWKGEGFKIGDNLPSFPGSWARGVREVSARGDGDGVSEADGSLVFSFVLRLLFIESRRGRNKETGSG